MLFFWNSSLKMSTLNNAAIGSACFTLHLINDMHAYGEEPVLIWVFQLHRLSSQTSLCCLCNLWIIWRVLQKHDWPTYWETVDVESTNIDLTADVDGTEARESPGITRVCIPKGSLPRPMWIWFVQRSEARPPQVREEVSWSVMNQDGYNTQKSYGGL